MSGDAHDFSKIEARAIIKFFFLQGKALKEIHAILTETLVERAPSYDTAKKLGGPVFPPVMCLVLDDPKQ
jgi:hypothetical protein